MPKKHHLVLYMPVLHQGYIRLFKAHQDIEAIHVLGKELLDETDYIRKDLRALTPAEQKKAIEGMHVAPSVSILTPSLLNQLDQTNNKVILPDEDVSRAVAEKFGKAKTSFYPIFLRWDRRAVNAQDPVNPDRAISDREFDVEMMKLATEESAHSSNVWRRVGAVITKDGKLLAKSSNRHVPSEFSLWSDGDPRSTLKKGADLEITNDMHAEAKLIANAARDGVALKGASIYVTNFPCPPCAKLIAEAGLAKCYYSAGYSLLDGEALLKAYEVEIIHVDVPESDGHPDEWVDYKKS